MESLIEKQHNNDSNKERSWIKMANMPKYIDIPDNPNFDNPEVFKEWVAVILDLIKDIKGKEWYSKVDLNLDAIVGDNLSSLSLTELTEIVTGLQGVIDSSSDELEDMQAMINSVLKQVLANKTSIDTIVTNITTLNNKVITNSNNIAKNTTNITTNKTSIESLKTRVTTAEGNITKILNTEIPRLDREITTIKNSASAVTTRVTTLENRTTRSEERRVGKEC